MFELPTHTLSDQEINQIIAKIHIPTYIGTLMSDEISGFKTENDVCAIINLQPHTEIGTHWTCFATIGSRSYYFDSYACTPPINVLKFLKSEYDYDHLKPRIFCNALIAQRDNATNCGALCIFVLFYLTRGFNFDKIIRHLHHLIKLPSSYSPSLWVTTTNHNGS